MYIGWELSVVGGDDQLMTVRRRLLAGMISCLVRLLRLTWRVHFHDRNVYEQARKSGAVVLTFWHGDQLCLIPLHGSAQIAGLASLSPDGALLATILKYFGYRVVRGSSSRGGDDAYHACIRELHNGVSPALAVDGPRGPRHSVRYGAARLAIESGRPIVFVAAHVNRSTVLSSWDRFVIPWLGTRVDVAYGCLRPAPEHGVEEVTETLQQRMMQLSVWLRSSSDLSDD